MQNMLPCPTCDGTRVVKSKDDFFVVCPGCGGDGSIPYAHSNVEKEGEKLLNEMWTDMKAMKRAIRAGRIHVGGALILFFIFSVFSLINLVMNFSEAPNTIIYFWTFSSLIGLILFIALANEFQTLADKDNSISYYHAKLVILLGVKYDFQD